MIKCNEYDYVEIVCMYRYPIKLTLKSGETINGTALDTQYNNAREECIKLSVEEIEKIVQLDTILKMDVSVVNPHFQTVTFT